MNINTITTAINAMTYEEQDKYLKKGLCFNCKQPRHLSGDCPRKNPWWLTSKGVEPPDYIQNQSSSGYSKPDAKEITKYIRTMNKEEQDELFEEVEKDDDLSNKRKDFWNGEWQTCQTSTLPTM